MYCSKCGVQNSDEATLCVNCGAVLGAPVAQPAGGIEAQTCGLAVASLVMGLLCMTCVLWPFLGLPAIICGIIALVKISNSHGQLKGTGLAVTGIVVPVVFTIIVPIAMAILMPALSQVRHVAERVVCGTNLKGLSTAMQAYVNDYDDTLPTEHWCDLLIEEADVSLITFVCPDSDTIDGESSYAMNKHVAGKKLSDLPADVVLFFETGMGLGKGPRNVSIQTRRYYAFLNEFGNVYDENVMVYIDRFNQFGGPEDLLLSHDGGCNIAFADGHVEFVPESRIAMLKWTVE